jgi:hypothetical protein
MSSPPDFFSKYQKWRPYAEPGFWIIFYCTWSIIDPLVVARIVKTYEMAKLPYEPWEIVVWTWTVNLVLLALVPAVVAFDRRFPLDWKTLRRNWRWHLLACLIYCVVHSIATSLLLKSIYLALGKTTFFHRSLHLQLAYDALKDFRHYLFVLIIIYSYRLAMLRLQGEASLLDKPDTGAPMESIERPERFLIRKVGKEFLLSAAEIEWIKAQGNYVNLRVNGHDYPLRSTMSAIETRLDPRRFVRVHRSYILNLRHMRRFHPVESGDARATMADGAEVPVSRRYLDVLRSAAVELPS